MPGPCAVAGGEQQSGVRSLYIVWWLMWEVYISGIVFRDCIESDACVPADVMSSLDNLKILGSISDDTQDMTNIWYARLDNWRLLRININR